MDESRRVELISQYRAGYDEVVRALEGINLDVASAGEWTPRQVVHHLADSEMTSAIRLRRLLAEDSPQIDGYDENEFARRLHYNRPIEASLAAFKAARDATAEILDVLTANDWARQGTHSESGRYSVETWLEIYARHGHDHAEQIRRARTGTPNVGDRRATR